MTDGTPPPAALGTALARVEAFADGVGRRTRFWGWLALGAAPALWAAVLGRWVFESWTVALAWLPVLLLLLVPGLVLLGFGKRVRLLADLPATVSGEIGSLVGEARNDIATEIEGVRVSGIGGLRSLIASLKDLRGYGDEIREILSGVAGTLRLVNPAYLVIVLGAAFAAGLLAIFLVVAVVLLLLIG